MPLTRLSVGLVSGSFPFDNAAEVVLVRFGAGGERGFEPRSCDRVRLAGERSIGGTDSEGVLPLGEVGGSGDSGIWRSAKAKTIVNLR